MTLFWWEMITLAVALAVWACILAVGLFIMIPVGDVVFNYWFR